MHSWTSPDCKLVRIQVRRGNRRRRRAIYTVGRKKEYEIRGWGWGPLLKHLCDRLKCRASHRKREKKQTSDLSMLDILDCERQSRSWRSDDEKEDMRGWREEERKYSVGGKTIPPPPSPPEQRLTSECVRCVGWRAGWMGRGGEGVGGNWRGVALTH